MFSNAKMKEISYLKKHKMKFRKRSHEQITFNRVLLKIRALDHHKHYKIIHSEKVEQIRTLEL